MLRLLHYEFIPGRPVGKQWRVGDENDDPVADFASESEALAYVYANNDKAFKDRQSQGWRYGLG